MVNLFSSVINSSLELLRNYVFKHLCFIVQVGDNTKSLNRSTGILAAKRNDILKQIQADEPAAREATNEVETWLQRAQHLQLKAHDIDTDYNNRGCVYINCFSSYKIGKKAAEELLEVETELKYIADVKEITTKAPPPRAQEVSTAVLTNAGGYEIESKLRMALDFLRDDDEDAHGELGLWGMGGVGKTTLLEHINNSLAKDPSAFGFHRVIFLVASRDCTVEKIQDLLVKNLGLHDREQIFSYMSKKSFVLLLDDLWEPLDLKQVGVPLPFGNVGQHKRKLILTTRFQQVCYNMDVHKIIEVKCLSPEAARLLFRERVGEEAISSHPLIAQLVDEVADECDGLPLALITVGRAMARNQTVQVWQNAARLLRDSKMSKIPGMVDPLPLLKFSYDHLKDPTEQQCFLHCALWPEDHKIHEERLIECWEGHGLLKEDCNDMQEVYNQGHAIIHSLLKACLLEQVESHDLMLKNQYVKLHDVIRDMALWIARDCGKNEKKWMVMHNERLPKDTRVWSEVHKMSAWDSRDVKFPSGIQSCPNLTTLILFNTYHLASSDLGTLKHFSALKFLDLSFWKLKDLPVEVCTLLKLEYLNISMTRITSLPKELKNLTNLKYLIAAGTWISELPHELITNLVNLLHLDLLRKDISQSSIIDGLNYMEGCLKALGITVSTPSDLQKLVRLDNISIRRLGIRGMEGQPSLRLLSCDILGVKHMHSNLKFLIISNCNPTVEKLVFDEEHCLSNLDELWLQYLTGLKEIIWKEVRPCYVLPNLRVVYITYCPLLTHVSWIVNCPCLENLSLQYCQNMKNLICLEAAETVEPCAPYFPRLRVLKMISLPNLDSMSDGLMIFPSLEYLEVYGCTALKGLAFQSPPPSLVQILAETEWWNDLEMDDDMRNTLQPFFMVNLGEV